MHMKMTILDVTVAIGGLKARHVPLVVLVLGCDATWKRLLELKQSGFPQFPL